MLTLGIDIGSTTSKCVVLEDGIRIVSRSLIGAGIGTDGPESAVRQALEAAGIPEAELASSAVTGYGRARWTRADYQLSELSAHALGAVHLFPDVRTIIDIGGQDAKVIAVGASGRMEQFLMNDKCAAGTGRFLDVMAAILQLSVAELEAQAALADAPAQISSTCTVFAESEVISRLAAGDSTPNIVAGICESVAQRTAAMAKRLGVRSPVVMSGGVAQNGGVREALSRALGTEIAVSPLAQHFGALGASIYAYRKEKNANK